MREPAARPVLALLTDFGTRDPYVGAMKGAALSVCADATLVDLTHDIAAHDVVEAARHLAAAAPYFPAGTAFVVVVDPGVGSARRALAVWAGGHWFVGPDNGVLTPVLTPAAAIVEITSPRYMRVPVSRTFEGRDRFAPAAAWLLRGVPLDALGPPVTDPVRLDLPRPQLVHDVLRGVLIAGDRFGNVATSIDRAAFEAFACGAPRAAALHRTRTRCMVIMTPACPARPAARHPTSGSAAVRARAEASAAPSGGPKTTAR